MATQVILRCEKDAKMRKKNAKDIDKMVKLEITEYLIY